MARNKDIVPLATRVQPVGSGVPVSQRSVDSLPQSVTPTETLARAKALAAPGTNDKAPRR